MGHVAASVIAGALVGAVAGAYGIGVRRRNASAGSWRRGRTVAFAAGLATIAVALVGPVAGLAERSFFFHGAQHVLLAMVAPPLLALGAPITLLLQTAPRPRKVRVLGALHSRGMRALTHPPLVLVLFVGGFFVLYLTPLYRLSVESEWLHVMVHIHFLATGVLFAWAVLALDPNPGSAGFPARLLMVLVVVPAHAVLGVALLSFSAPIAPFVPPGPPFGWNALQDQQAGTALMWVVGEIVAVGLLGILLIQWRNAEEGVARRIDRIADTDR